MKEQEKEREEQKRMAYLKMCDDNEEKVREREKKYKEYFQQFDGNLQQRQMAHDFTAGEDQRAKTKRLMDWEQNNEKLYQRIDA